jgi:hypothetical protein
MGTVNLYRGLNSEKQIFNFTGKLKDNLDLDWEHTEIIKNGEKLNPDYELNENEVLIIQETPGGLVTIAVILGVVALGVGIGAGVYANEQAKKAQREMEEALKRIGKDNKKNEVASIPQLGDARNEKIDGKNVPIFLGRHLFAPYFLSEPYMKPGGTDGEDLYWYGTFLVGQNGLCFEKIRNGVTELVNFTEDEPQQIKGKPFIDPLVENPPFYNPDNYIDIVQKGNYKTINDFTCSVFEQKWADSLDSSVELGRKKIDNAKAGNVGAGGIFAEDENGIFIEDDGAEPIIRETARFPMLAEIEISFPDGLFGWDSKNGAETSASVEIKLEWSKDGNTEWREIPVSFENSQFVNSQTGAGEIISSDTKIADFVKRFIPQLPAIGNTHTYNLVMPNGGKFGDKEISAGAVIILSRFVSATYQDRFYFRIQIPSIEIDIRAYAAVNATPAAQIGKALQFYNPSGTNGSNTLTRARSSQMRFIFTADFSHYSDVIYSKSGDPVFIRATRLTRMHTGSYRDRVYLTAIRTRQYNPNTSKPSGLIAAKNINETYKDKFCRMGIKLKVNKNTQEFMDRFNVVASMTGRTALGEWKTDLSGIIWKWNGQWSTVKTKTSNSAAVLLELITGLIHDPSKHTDGTDNTREEVDLRTFGKLYEYCANRSVRVEGVRQKFTLECNGVLTSGTRKIDAIQQALATCDGGLYVDEFGMLKVYYEDIQDTPIALLNPQRIISMVDQRSLDRKPDGYAVEFVDQDSGWTQKTHRILRPLVKVDSGLNTYSPVKLDFTTSYNQAMWHARRLLAKEEHRPGEIKCTVGKEGRYYKPGSLIKVQHERFKIGLGSGEITQLIKDGNQIVGLKLMERFDISKERDYWIEYYVVDEDRNKAVDSQVVDGVRKKGMQIQSVGEYTDRLMFEFPIDADSPDVPEFQNILSVMYGEEGSVTVQEAKRYIVTGLSENANGYDLTLAEYADVIYTDSEIKDIPQRKSSILSAPPTVFSDRQRNAQQLLLEALCGQANPENIDRIARAVARSEISKIPPPPPNPKYLGAFKVTGTVEIIDGVKTGKVGDKTAEIGDWYAYVGPSISNWENGACYTWTGEVWEQVPFVESSKYMAALGDLTDGASNGYFNALFANYIFSNIVNAEVGAFNKIVAVGGYSDEIDSLLDFADMSLEGLEEFAEKFLEKNQNQIIMDGEHGEIKSGNYVSSFNSFGFSPSGWCIKNKKDGNGIQAEFTDVKAVNMIADNGTFVDCTSTNLTIVGGSINIGPLSVDDENKKFWFSATFPAVTPAAEFVDRYFTEDPLQSDGAFTSLSVDPPDGSTYGGNVLTRMSFTKTWNVYGQGGGSVETYYLVKTVTFYTDGGATTRTDGEHGIQQNIGAIAVIAKDRSTEGKTVIIGGLPTLDPHLKGALYVSTENNVLYISKG